MFPVSADPTPRPESRNGGISRWDGHAFTAERTDSGSYRSPQRGVTPFRHPAVVPRAAFRVHSTKQPGPGS